MKALLERVEPSARARVMLGVAALVWASAWSGQSGWPIWTVLVMAGATAILGVRATTVAMVAVVCCAGWWSGHLSVERDNVILAYQTPAGAIDARIRLLEDPAPGEFGWWALAVPDPHEPGRPPAAPLLVSFEERPEAAAGELIEVGGHRATRSGRAGGRAYSGVLSTARVSPVTGPIAPWWKAGNAVRHRTLQELHDRGREYGLLAGFLVGDVTQVPESDLEAMRRTGLTHLVAVSGSNVALFLTLTMLAAGPIAAGPRRRAVLGLAAIGVFVVATRWEPSVIRAAVMAALILAGRVGGWVLDTLTALGVTVAGVILVSAKLVSDVGFILSVVATLGVTVGGRLAGGGGKIGMALAVTVGAQLAVAPILLASFGTVPLLAPVANLVAVPVVAFATTVGTIGVATGLDFIVELAAWGSRFVLAVAGVGASWPQVGWLGMAVVMVTGGLGAVPRLRPLVVIAAGAAMMVLLVGPTTRIQHPAVVFLDVGQGDSILVLAGDDRTMLVDGGPDPGVLEAKLAEYGVMSLDLVVLTHVHSDHAAGLEAVVGRRRVGQIWLPGQPHDTRASQRIAELSRVHGVPVGPAPVGAAFRLGDLAVEVIGPVRRYASPNDQSIVLRMAAEGGPSLLLTGDIETHAQRDLTDLRADILKVPHQGGATSDLGWLAQVGSTEAVISVGPNDFGHPSPDVIAALTAGGSHVRRTDREGDIVIPLNGAG